MAGFEDVSPVPKGHLGIAVLGEGTDAVLIAELQAAALSTLDTPSIVQRVETNAENLPSAVARLAELGYKGVNVGHPFKPAAARLAAHFFVVKHSLGTANALLLDDGGVYAQNTEVTAFIKALEGINPSVALMLGAGHSARSAVMALLESGWKVRIWSRSALKAKPLIGLLQRYGQIDLLPSPDPVGVGLIVNATPMGMRPGEMPPINWNHVQRGAVICDLVVRRVNTEMIRAATLRGLKTIDGRDLLVEQAGQALEWWLGKSVPRESMHAQARKKPPVPAGQTRP